MRNGFFITITTLFINVECFYYNNALGEFREGHKVTLIHSVQELKAAFDSIETFYPVW